MQLTEQVQNVGTEPTLVSPSKWHIFYWLKWKFVIKPKLKKELVKAQAQMVGDIINGNILRHRADKDA